MFLHYLDEEWSFETTDKTARRVAAGLVRLGIKKGDNVAIFMDNCPELLFLCFGIYKLGAVAVPVNVAHRGEILAYLLEHPDPKLLVFHTHYWDRIGLALSNVKSLGALVAVEAREEDRAPEGGSAASLNDLSAGFSAPVLSWADLVDNDGTYPREEVRFSDPAMIIYTAGTTGLPKGVVLPHNQLYSAAERHRDCLGVTDEDCVYNCMPLFHAVGWHGGVNLALVSGARLALARRFSASRFWNDIRRYGATVCPCAGSVTSVLFRQEPRPDDANNPLRFFLGGPTPPELFETFEQRFGVRNAEFYGTTEIAAPTMNRPFERKIGSCGKIHPDFEVHIIGENGVECQPGIAGEIAVRPRKPYNMMLGYYKNPQATVEAWRDLWFRTGDFGYLDEDGYLHFSDRKKDVIRRRGENLSSFEVEKIINSHPAVLESAVIGVRSELGEEEVMACVVPAPGSKVAPEEIVAYCEGRMAYFMVPRYIRFVDSLPKTPSYRVEKYKLREEGITPDTWDREKAGYKLKR
jgi:crotonobetaine/carnitine-CoA ligase